MDQKYFLHQIKRTNDVFSKGIVVNDTYDGAKQGYHAYLGAYSYGHDQGTDYVSCMITDIYGTVLMTETWLKPVEEQEEEPEEEPESV